MSIFKSIGRRFVLAALLFTSSVMTQAVDLPVRTIAGKEYFYYVAQNGDTALSVAKALGITSSRLIGANPSVEDGLRKGQTLYFPVDKFGDDFGRSDAQAMLAKTDVGDEARVHVVSDDETLFGIARRYDVSPDEIVALNPWAASGIHAKQRLVLPAKAKDGGDAKTQKTKAQHAANKPRPAEPVKVVHEQPTEELTPVKPAIAEVTSAPAEIKTQEMPVANVSEATAAANDTIVDRLHRTIAVVLPFGLASETPDKRASLATDFYRGFLLAADTLAKTSWPIRIKTFDAGATGADTKRLFAELNALAPDIIIGSSDKEQFDILGDFARSKGIYAINSFLVKDSTYLTNPYVVQTYIPQADMYAKAVDFALSFLQNNPGTIPVLLDNKTGDRNKEELVNMLVERLAQNGITPLTLSYDGNLLQSEISATLAADGKYLLIPMSGSLKEYNRIVHPLTNFIEKESAAAGGTVNVLGYPEWTAFRGSARDNLSKIHATVYSRFFADPSSLSYQGVNDAYKKWYGRDLPGEVPVQALLGFDTGEFIIRALNASGGDLSEAPLWQGVQSSFKLERESAPQGGLSNRSLYIIEFLPGDAVNIDVR